MLIFRSSVSNNHFTATISVWQTYDNVLGREFCTFLQLCHSNMKSRDISQLIFLMKFLLADTLIYSKFCCRSLMSKWIFCIATLEIGSRLVHPIRCHINIERWNLLAVQPIQWSDVECLLYRCDQDSSSLQVVSTCSNSLNGSYQVEPDRFDERKIRNFLHFCETEVWLAVQKYFILQYTFKYLFKIKYNGFKISVY